MAEYVPDVIESPLGSAYDMISLFVDTTEAQRVMMSVWAAHTHIYRRFVATPRLSFVADGPGTGKSVAMSVALSLSNEPLAVGYASQASVYSWLEERPDTTLGLDEIDKVFGVMGRKTSRAVLAAVVNDGYSSGGQVMVMRGGRPVLMPVFAPVATAGIGQLPEDTRTRALEVRLTRGSPSEAYVPELHARMMGAIGKDLGHALSGREARKALGELPAVTDALTGVTPRQALIMTPLVGVATLLGVREAFLAAVSEWQTGESDIPIRSASEVMAEAIRPYLSDVPVTATELAALLTGAGWEDIPLGRVGADYVAGLLRQGGIEPYRAGNKYGYVAPRE